VAILAFLKLLYDEHDLGDTNTFTLKTWESSSPLASGRDACALPYTTLMLGDRNVSGVKSISQMLNVWPILPTFG